MATNTAQETWFANVIGKSVDVDGAYGYQCKDVVDSYCQAIWGNWTDTIRPNNAKDCFNGCNPDYFDRIPQDWNDPNQIPIRGDIIVYDASKLVPEGHIAVVESATNENITVIQQDGYLQIPTHRKVLGYTLDNGARCIGWLRPKNKEEVMNREDCIELYRTALHREPENDAAINLRIGMKPSDALRDIQNTDEWKLYNHYVKHFSMYSATVEQQRIMIDELKEQAAAIDKKKLETIYEVIGKALGK